MRRLSGNIGTKDYVTPSTKVVEFISEQVLAISFVAMHQLTNHETYYFDPLTDW